MLDVVYSAFTRTAYPWLIAANVKIGTLMKKLILLHQSNRARNELLATDNAWSVRMFFQSQLNTWMVENGQPVEWKWSDEIDIQPIKGEEEELPMDIMDGPLEIEAQETIGNKNAWLQSYTGKKLQENIVYCTYGTGWWPGPWLQQASSSSSQGEVTRSSNGICSRFLGVMDCFLTNMHAIDSRAGLWGGSTYTNDEFEEMSKEELDILYPWELPEAMEAKLGEEWRGKQLGSAISKLKAIAIYVSGWCSWGMESWQAEAWVYQDKGGFVEAGTSWCQGVPVSLHTVSSKGC